MFYCIINGDEFELSVKFKAIRGVHVCHVKARLCDASATDRKRTRTFFCKNASRVSYSTCSRPTLSYYVTGTVTDEVLHNQNALICL